MTTPTWKQVSDTRWETQAQHDGVPGWVLEKSESSAWAWTLKSHASPVVEIFDMPNAVEAAKAEVARRTAHQELLAKGQPVVAFGATVFAQHYSGLRECDVTVDLDQSDSPLLQIENVGTLADARAVFLAAWTNLGNRIAATMTTTTRADTFLDDEVTRTKVLVGIDPSRADEAFPATIDPRITWNGWECPSFDRETAEQVIAWATRELDGVSFAWDGDTLVMVDGGEVDRIAPDGDGGYPIGAWAWCWRILTADELSNLADGHAADHLEAARPDDDSTVEAPGR